MTREGKLVSYTDSEISMESDDPSCCMTGLVDLTGSAVGFVVTFPVDSSGVPGRPLEVRWFLHSWILLELDSQESP